MEHEDIELTHAYIAASAGGEIAASAGRPDAAAVFRRVYDRYSGPLFRFLYRFTGDSQAAEEIVHDIFVQLLSGKYSGDPDSTLKSWLFAVAKNRGLNYTKRNQPHRRGVGNGAAVLERVLSSQDLEAEIVNSSLLTRLSVAEKSLPFDLSETWALRKTGLDHRQIAARLSIPVGTVKSRFSRLVTLLKSEFDHEPEN